MTMTDRYLTKWTHEGYEIGVMANGLFRLTDEETTDTFISLARAKEYVHKLGLSERSSVNLDLPLMLDDGKTVKVRRIHNGTGKWMTEPRIDSRYGTLSGYKPGLDAEALLVERKRLNKLRELNEAALVLVRIDFPQVYRKTPEDIQTATEKAILRYNAV
jgi:hypothetical protein